MTSGNRFRTADGIAQKLGFEKDDFARIRSGIMYTLSALADEGHVYAEREQLIKKAVELLEADEMCIAGAIEKMRENKDLICEAWREEEGDSIYLPPFYYAETGVASRLRRLTQTPAQDRLWTSLMQARQKTGNQDLSVDVKRFRSASIWSTMRCRPRRFASRRFQSHGAHGWTGNRKDDDNAGNHHGISVVWIKDSACSADGAGGKTNDRGDRT